MCTLDYIIIVMSDKNVFTHRRPVELLIFSIPDKYIMVEFTGVLESRLLRKSIQSEDVLTFIIIMRTFAL